MPLPMILFLNGCVTPGSATDMTVALVTLPVKIVCVAIAAAIGSAAGMGFGPL